MEPTTNIAGYNPVATAGDCWFDSDAAAHPVRFIENGCCHIEGALTGQRFILEQWQKDIIGAIFGWKKRDEQGREVRRYREVFVYVPRKNGKTPMVAAIACYVFFCDNEGGQQNYCAAGEREQAGLLYRHMSGMIDRKPSLKGKCQNYKATKRIVKPDGSFMAVLSADADTKHGGNSHLVIIDELHVQPNRDLVDTLVTSMASANRAQPLLIHITTADYGRESICNEKYDYACKVRDGIIDDPAFLPVIYEAKKDADWREESTWRDANPNIGVSVSLDYLKRECKRAQEEPSYENTFKRLHLNIRTEQAERWLQMDRWDACADELPDLTGMECYCGLDLSTTTDISAFVKVFRLDGKVILLPTFWIPRENAIARERKDRVPYLTWARQGLIEMTEGNVIDYDVIRKRINEDRERYDIKEIAIDRWNSTQLQTQLVGDGFEVVLFGQGYKDMTAPTKEFEKLVMSGDLVHGSNPVLRWMASNASVERDAADNIKASKSKSTERIDGLIAAIMGIGRMMLEPEIECVYDYRGVDTA